MFNFEYLTWLSSCFVEFKYWKTFSFLLAFSSELSTRSQVLLPVSSENNKPTQMLFFLTYKHKRWRPDRWNAKLSSVVCEENVFHWYQTGLRSPATCCDSPMTLSSRFLNVLYFTGWFYYLDFTTWRRLEAALLFVGIVELYPPWWWKVSFFSFHATRRNGFVVLRRQFSIDFGYIHTFRLPRLKSLFLWLSGKLWASGQRGRTKATTEKR